MKNLQSLPFRSVATFMFSALFLVILSTAKTLTTIEMKESTLIWSTEKTGIPPDNLISVDLLNHIVSSSTGKLISLKLDGIVNRDHSDGPFIVISLRPHCNMPYKFLTDVPLPLMPSPIESTAFSFNLSAETNILKYINDHPSQTFHIVVIAGTIYGNMQVGKCSLTVQQQESEKFAFQPVTQILKTKTSNLVSNSQRLSAPVQISEDATVVAIEMKQPKTVSFYKGSGTRGDTSSTKLLKYRGASAIDGTFKSFKLEGVVTGGDTLNTMLIVIIYRLNQSLEAMEDVLITPKLNKDTAFSFSSDVDDKLLELINDEPTSAFVITARAVSLAGKATIKKCSLRLKKHALNQPELQLQSNHFSEFDAEDQESTASDNWSLAPKLEREKLDSSLAARSNSSNSSKAEETEGGDTSLVTCVQCSSEKPLEAADTNQIMLGNISDNSSTSASLSSRQENSSNVDSLITRDGRQDVWQNQSKESVSFWKIFFIVPSWVLGILSGFLIIAVLAVLSILCRNINIFPSRLNTSSSPKDIIWVSPSPSRKHSSEVIANHSDDKLYSISFDL